MAEFIEKRKIRRKYEDLQATLTTTGGLITKQWAFAADTHNIVVRDNNETYTTHLIYGAATLARTTGPTGASLIGVSTFGGYSSTNVMALFQEMNTAILARSSDTVTEGTTNLYFTNERVDDRINALLVAGSGISLSYNDGSNTLTITNSATAGLTGEETDDRVAALLQDGTGISWSYNDGSNTLTPTISLSSFSTTNLSEGSNLYYTDERVDDRVNALLVAGSGVSFSYNDGANTLTINASGSGGTLGGSGTVGTVPMFVTNTTTLGSSLISQSSDIVTIDSYLVIGSPYPTNITGLVDATGYQVEIIQDASTQGGLSIISKGDTAGFNALSLANIRDTGSPTTDDYVSILFSLHGAALFDPEATIQAQAYIKALKAGTWSGGPSNSKVNLEFGVSGGIMTLSSNGLVIPGGISTGITHISVADTPYTVQLSDSTIIVDSSGGNVDINMRATTDTPGRRIDIKKTNEANLVYIFRNGSETLDDQTQIILNALNESIQFISDSSEEIWRVV